MTVLIVINRLNELTYRQTTALLAAAASRLGHDVLVCEVASVTATALSERAAISLSGVLLPAGTTDSHSVADIVSQQSPIQFHAVQPDDIILIRTNPGRDPSRQPLHHSFLELMMIAERGGSKVVNRPDHLFRFASKASLLLLDPSFRPAMLVSSHYEALQEFVMQANVNCVIKPLQGSRGMDVRRVAAATGGLPSNMAKEMGSQPYVVQHFVQADHPGDRRVVVLDGEILEFNGDVRGHRAASGRRRLSCQPACRRFGPSPGT